MENKVLKERLKALCDSIDLALIDPDKYQAYDLDPVVTSETKSAELIDWFLETTGSTGRRSNAFFVMSHKTFELVRDMHDDVGTYLYAPGIGLHPTIIGQPFMLKAII